MVYQLPLKVIHFFSQKRNRTAACFCIDFPKRVKKEWPAMFSSLTSGVLRLFALCFFAAVTYPCAGGVYAYPAPACVAVGWDGTCTEFENVPVGGTQLRRMVKARENHLFMPI